MYFGSRCGFEFHDWYALMIASYSELKMKECVCFRALKWLDRHLKVFETEAKKLKK